MEQTSTVNAEPVVNVEPQETVTEPVESEIVQSEATEPNTEEVAKPQQSKEDNAKYAAIRREAEKKARDQMISEMYGESHGLHTYSDYQKAIEKEKQRKLAEEKGYDYDSLEEIINQDPRIKQASELLTKKEQEERRQQEMFEFLDYYQEAFGETFKGDELPKEVVKMTEQGIPLTVAYKAVAETQHLRNKLKEYETKQNAEKVNSKNEETSTGGINPNTQADTDFISAETFEANRSNMDWVKKNLDKLTKSRLKW